MSFFICAAGGIALLVVVAAIYTTLSTNQVANHQDCVRSVPSVATEREAWLRALGAAAGARSMDGNTVLLLQNGAAIFPPMLAAIEGSRQTVHFSNYVFWSGLVADSFADALCAAARRGVTVRLIIDRQGSSSKLDQGLVRRLSDAGCHIAWYRRAQWFTVLKYDRRTHRRLLVVDGRVAFTGGVGIADQWAGDGDGPAHWRDTHVRLTGPAVADVQAGFTESWNECTEELLLDAVEYPALESTGRTTVSVVMSTPTDGGSSAQRTMAACIASAGSSLRITNAYMVPTPAFVDALRAAAARRVAVRIIMPGPYHNKPLVRRASRHTWRALIAGGVELYEQQRTMVHAKTLIIDSHAALVGSINFDPRSFSLNAESGLVITDEAIAAEMTRVFAGDLAQCARVDPAALEQLSPLDRLGDALCYWFRAQL